MDFFPEPVRDLHDSPVTSFELFMTDKLTDHICIETNTYAAQNETIHLKLIQMR